MNEVDLTNLPTVEKISHGHWVEYRAGEWSIDGEDAGEDQLVEDIRSFVALLRFVREEENGLSAAPPGD